MQTDGTAEQLVTMRCVDHQGAREGHGGCRQQSMEQGGCQSWQDVVCKVAGSWGGAQARARHHTAPTHSGPAASALNLPSHSLLGEVCAPEVALAGCKPCI